MPISLSWIYPTRLGLLSQGHLCRFSVRTSSHPFHGLPGSTDFRHHTFTYFSPLRLSIGFSAWTVRRHRSIYPEVSDALRHRLDGAGILTCFPFDMLQLGHILGPANPWLTNIAKETLPLRRSGFTPDYAATIARILVPARSTLPHGDASTQTGRPPTGSPHGALGYRWSA